MNLLSNEGDESPQSSQFAGILNGILNLRPTKINLKGEPLTREKFSEIQSIMRGQGGGWTTRFISPRVHLDLMVDAPYEGMDWLESARRGQGKPVTVEETTVFVALTRSIEAWKEAVFNAAKPLGRRSHRKMLRRSRARKVKETLLELEFARFAWHQVLAREFYPHLEIHS